jgi:glycosyltransferase involved in cell wall biosynthesis
MKIALVSKIWEPTSAHSIGGTGFIVGALTDALVERGHDVTLYASGDSETKAKLVAVVEKHSPTYFNDASYYLNIAKAFKDAEKYDIIDCHVDEKSLFFMPLIKTPVICSIGYGYFTKDQKQIFREYKDQNFLSISNALRKVAPEANWIATVYNGIRVEDFPFSDKKGDYLFFLGRVSEQKGIKYAVQAALKAGIKLVVAGKTPSADKEYLDKYFWPYVDDKKIKYIGPVNYKEKMPLLKNALALVSPICVLEAFGLNLVEANACGTPVIVFDRGAAREVIKDGETGFVTKPDDTDAIVEAVKKLDSIDRKKCRRRIEDNFSIEKMAAGYEKVYSKLVKTQTESRR